MVGKSNRTKEEKAGIVMEVLSNTATIAEICRRHNIASSALYAWRDAFISGGTAALEPGKSSRNIQSQKEIVNLKNIIGELTIANEALKKIQYTGRGGRP
ncbi:Transposase IS3/IS911 [mine drainage metagenome]|uniref:Transposase IS3/IS911 n=3 Tax=mine drainage metagenome TaxID=410659 RepID=T0ZAZ4_9ZZZZ